ncbi:SDR family NAD(P)-dependent oxidoreductase [Heliorestis acidaminivorans]|uniref:SDR family NAD(P)-dependent oxidoreductase n=1 Tax=Heliorestis acidaminivorans TaxID=553427 RepID=A0A6I0F2H5_9FIRM|nr:SDR family NAD(P)-dependent oxidoreductase [Heliorestis acidaminivorans]KAB2953760.1 SDR family NAD(P)-dependent oxidoreductase [Heliorestis acidaminivorans]
MKTILVTGVAGFIGSKVTEMLIDQGYHVVGIDNLNDYYDVRIKNWRLAQLETKKDSFTFYPIDIENLEDLDRVFQNHKIDAVMNLAARAGVRYSMENPHIYMTTNANGHLNILEFCRKYEIQKVILASTSSLYAGQKMPFTEELPVNTPISPYAASKKAAEAMSYSYHYLYGLDISIVRYFTVYGPAGRPDMSVFRFIKWTLEGKSLEIFGDGSQSRDFTYVDDIARGTIKALNPLGFEVINLGNNNPDKLSKMIEYIENYSAQKSQYEHKPFHKADITATWADISKAKALLDWEPQVSLEEGIERTVKWTKENWDWLKKVKL